MGIKPNRSHDVKNRNGAKHQKRRLFPISRNDYLTFRGTLLRRCIVLYESGLFHIEKNTFRRERFRSRRFRAIKLELKRFTDTERRWNRNDLARSSPKKKLLRLWPRALRNSKFDVPKPPRLLLLCLGTSVPGPYN